MIGRESGAWIAQAVFAIVLAWGLIAGEISVKGASIFACIWMVAFIAREYMPNGAVLFSPFVALLDVVLVLVIFKGDVRLT